VTFPLVPESASAWPDTLERTGTYQHPGLRHAPRRFPAQASQWHAPGVSRHRFRALPACALDTVVLHQERECAQKVPGPCTQAPLGSEDAPQAPFARKTTSSFEAFLSHAADLATMRQINVGRILHQQNHGRGSGLFSGLVHMRLHQGSKGDIWLIKPTIQRFGFFPGVHLSGQRTPWILRQVGGRFDRSSRSTETRAVGRPQRFARPSPWDPTLLVCSSCILSLCKMWVRIRLESKGFLARSL
jgi:hypothetical protein